MREFNRPVYWKSGSDIIVLSDVVAVWTFEDKAMYVYFKHCEPIKVSYANKQIRDSVAKDLSSALEMHLLERGGK